MAQLFSEAQLTPDVLDAGCKQGANIQLVHVQGCWQEHARASAFTMQYGYTECTIPHTIVVACDCHVTIRKFWIYGASCRPRKTKVWSLLNWYLVTVTSSQKWPAKLFVGRIRRRNRGTKWEVARKHARGSDFISLEAKKLLSILSSKKHRLCVTSSIRSVNFFRQTVV